MPPKTPKTPGTPQSSELQGQLLRGASFVAAYHRVDAQLDASSQASTPDHSELSEEAGMRREPTMLRGGNALVAPQVDNDKRYTIVLDLDETVVYARDGPLYARAHLQSLLKTMNEIGEVIVWTAGERKYAKAILQEINVDNIIKHLIYRHKTWFDPKDYTKDLTRLGRDVNYVLIIENTPDCVRVNPQNGIIVEDFEGAVDDTPLKPVSPPVSPVVKPTTPTSATKKEDHTFVHLMQLIRDLGASGEPVPDFLAKCKLLRRQIVKGSTGEEIPIFYLTSKKRIYRPRISTGAPAPITEGTPEVLKVVKANRDKKASDEPDAPPPKTPTTPSKKRQRDGDA